MDRGDDFVLVETMLETAYRREYLSRAINLHATKQISTLLLDKTTMYCLSFSRHAFARVAWELTITGYGKVRDMSGVRKTGRTPGYPRGAEARGTRRKIGDAADGAISNAQ